MPTTPHHRPGWGCAVGCLCATTVACTGCGTPLCPSTTFPAQIFVSLTEATTAAEELLLTVSCPEDALECGFLDGPATGSAGGSVMISTVLRPPEVQVVVTERLSGVVVREERLPVAYEARGPRQTDCGGDAQALVVVPVD